MKTDAEIQQDVLRELKWDTRVRETDIGIAVDDGIVTLTGTVATWAERTAAQDAAHRVAGVLDVVDEIRVRPAGSELRTDAELAAAVRHALQWHALVPDERIRTTISEGEVTLEGDVDVWTQRDDAERSIANLAGVRAIHNHIEVRPPGPALVDVRHAIEDALERHVIREAKRVNVDVRDDRVVVSGTVHSLKEREAIIGAVKGTRGVAQVEAHLSVEP